MKKFLVAILLLAVVAGGAYYAWKQGLIQIPGLSAEIAAPIDVKNADGVGALHIELVYDASALEAVKVKAGKLAKNAMMESNLKTPGRVIIGIVEAEGITGDGTVATVTFKSKSKSAQTALTLENVQAHSAETLHELVAETTPGAIGGSKPNPAVIRFPGE